MAPKSPSHSFLQKSTEGEGDLDGTADIQKLKLSNFILSIYRWGGEGREWERVALCGPPPDGNQENGREWVAFR